MGKQGIPGCLSHDGERILTVADDPYGSRNRPELWARDGRRLSSLDWASCSTVVVPVFDEQARYIALPGGADLSIMDWDGAYVARLAGPAGTMLCDSAYSSGGDLIAALFDDGMCRIWNVTERRRTKSLRLGDARTIAFSGDGQMLLAGSRTGSISCHALEIEDLFRAGAHRVARVLERDELERFGIDSPRLDAETLHRYRGEGPLMSGMCDGVESDPSHDDPSTPHQIPPSIGRASTSQTPQKPRVPH